MAKIALAAVGLAKARKPGIIAKICREKDVDQVYDIRDEHKSVASPTALKGVCVYLVMCPKKPRSGNP